MVLVVYYMCARLRQWTIEVFSLLRQQHLVLGRHILTSFGIIFLFIESYEVVTDNQLTFPYMAFLTMGVLLGVINFIIDGIFVSGFMLREVLLPIQNTDTVFRMKYGDIFEEDGWKVISVNNFFDNIVDEDLVSSQSLHGHVLNKYWSNNSQDWKQQIKKSLKGVSGVSVNRARGNKTKYPIGTTARASINDHDFLFVALGETSVNDNTASANTEMLINAVRGMASEARAACSMRPLIVPLMGDGLSRVGMHPSVLVELIITALVEESRHGKITGEITIVLHSNRTKTTNLKNHARNWKHGK